jgi:hypothetical protein
MLAEVLEMSRVERKHGRMVYNILNQTIDSGVNADYYDFMEKYYALAQCNKLRIAHYPLYGQLSYSKCFAPKEAAEIRANGASQTDTVCINTLFNLRGYDKSPFMANFHPVRLLNRIYVANFNS